MTYLAEYRTWTKTNVMPPKPAAKPVQPATMDDLIADAKRCNAKMRRKWGDVSNVHGCDKNNSQRMAAARKRDEAMMPIILDLLKTGPKSRKQIVDGTGLSDDTSKRVLQRMKDDRIITGSGRHKIRWSIA